MTQTRRPARERPPGQDGATPATSRPLSVGIAHENECILEVKGVALRNLGGAGDSPHDLDYPVVAEWVMYYPGYLQDLAAAVAYDRDRRERAARASDRRGGGGAAPEWTPTRAAAAATVAAAFLALVAPTPAAHAAPRATADLTEVESVGTVACGIADLVSITPPGADHPCLHEWWSWQHYLATLPPLP